MKIANNLDFVSIFEDTLANYTNFKYAICVDCCTNGILLSLELLKRLGKISKSDAICIPKHTYMSVPMTLVNNSWNIKLVDDKWYKFYQLGKTNVYDAATDFHYDMHKDYSIESIVCISFQQKKRLSLGRGGAILTDNIQYKEILQRMRYDGRNPYVQDNNEIANSPDDMILGYHCYMEPDKAAVGILKMNQQHLLPKYKMHSYLEYEDLSKLKIWK